jgi:hypothetical protein
MADDYDPNNRISTTDAREFFSMLFTFDLDELVEWVGGWGISRALFLGILFIGMLSILARQIPNMPLFASEWLVGTAPVWLPLVLVVGAWKVWIWYIRSNFLSKVRPILLEVKMPREVMKSPRAMEVALSNLWINSGETTFFNRWWNGSVRPFFSLEITSFGGEVHFFIWAWERYKNVVESAIYAQYPEVELHEVEDYALKYQFDAERDTHYCTDWRLEPRNDAYPLRTYVEFELDKDPKEEFKVDPLAQMLELMSSLKPAENMWIQIIFTQNKDKRRSRKSFTGESRWENLLKDEVEEIRRQSFIKPPGGTIRPMASWRQTEQMRAIERNLGKVPFDVGLRGVYFAENKHFHRPNFTALRWIWRPIGNPQYLNHLRPRRWHSPFDYPWQDVNDYRYKLTSRRFFDAYRRRSFFYTPWITPYNTMSSETLATMWHPPSRAVAAPGLQRIAATKAEPPPNLPK